MPCSLVLPSDIEGLSLALLDAMGAGVCALTSDIAENCELVEGAGFTFKRGDVNDLERMLRWNLTILPRIEKARYVRNCHNFKGVQGWNQLPTLFLLQFVRICQQVGG